MEHSESCITEKDVAYIASLGMDHIRLGFDQIVLEESPYVYRNNILDILKNFASWCRKYGLRAVLNMHKAVGNYCDILEEKGLMQSKDLQDRFIALWLKIEEEFIEEHPDKVLWCGEFGTIRHTKLEWRENWMRDVITLLKEMDIPYCVRNYLSTGNDGNRFSLVDDDERKILSDKMQRIILGEV